MDISNLTPKDWTDLFQKYPFVQDFMIERALRNEYHYLKNELDALERMRAKIFGSDVSVYSKCWKDSEYAKRLTWVAQRVAEIETHCPYLLQPVDQTELDARAEYEQHSQAHMS